MTCGPTHHHACDCREAAWTKELADLHAKLADRDATIAKMREALTPEIDDAVMMGDKPSRVRALIAEATRICVHPPGCTICNWCGFRANEAAIATTTGPERVCIGANEDGVAFCRESGDARGEAK